MPINEIHRRRKILSICNSLIHGKQTRASSYALSSLTNCSSLAASLVLYLFLVACGGEDGGSDGGGPKPTCDTPDISCVLILGEKDEEVNILHHNISIDSVEESYLISLQLRQAGQLIIKPSNNYTITRFRQRQDNKFIELAITQRQNGDLLMNRYLDNDTYELTIQGTVGNHQLTIEFLQDMDKDRLVDKEDTGTNANGSTPCRLLADCDTDGIEDVREKEEFNGTPCRVIPNDCDKDGLADIHDTESFANTPCNILVDCDKDGIDDMQDTMEFDGTLCKVSVDCDGDGIEDAQDNEEFNGTPCRIIPDDCDGDGLADVHDTGSFAGTLCKILSDCDGDGLTDKKDIGTNANVSCRLLPDCDGDGLADAQDSESFNGTLCKVLSDCDDDGLTDKKDIGTNLNNSTSCRLLPDCDGDGLADAQDTGSFEGTLCKDLKRLRWGWTD